MKYLPVALIFSTTLLLSACGGGASGDAAPDTELGAANQGTTSGTTTPEPGDTGTTGGSTGSGTDTGTTGGSTGSGTDTGTTGGSTSQPTTNPSAPTSPTTAGPQISFRGTTFSTSVTEGDTIILDGSNSTTTSGELTSFSWKQIANGSPSVTLTNPDTATASFVASKNIDRAKLSFELTVTASDNATASSTIDYQWIVNAPVTEAEIDAPVDTTTAPSDNTDPATVNGSFAFGKVGDFVATDVNNVYVTDQTRNQIIHIDLETGTELNVYGLSARPEKMVYMESTQRLIVSFESANKLTTIDTLSGLVSDVTVDGDVQGLAVYNDSVYFTIIADPTDYELFSFQLGGTPKSHAIVQGGLIDINPANGDIIAVDEGQNPSTVYLYKHGVGDYAVEHQTSQDLGSNSHDISFSPDGRQLAISASVGNGGDFTIFDIASSDLAVSNGEWDTGAYPRSSDFNKSGELFAASDSNDLIIFDAATHVLVDRHDLNEKKCGLNYYNTKQVKFTADGMHALAKMECGSAQERTVLYYYEIPDAAAIANANTAAVVDPGTDLTVPVDPNAPTDPNVDDVIIKDESVVAAQHSSTYTLPLMGSYYAESESSVYVADQLNNKLIQIDLATGSEIRSFQLTDSPVSVVYSPDHNALYVNLKIAAKIAKIDLNTGMQTDILIDTRAYSLDAYDGRLYYTTKDTTFDFNLYSMGAEASPHLHGEIDGELIKFNHVTGELIVATRGSNAGKLHVYTVLPDSVAKKEENIRIGGEPQTLSISPDGTQLAAASTGGNKLSGRSSIFDFKTSSISETYGNWDTAGDPRSAYFSPNGELLVATEGVHLLIFSAKSHELIVKHDIDEDLCGLEQYQFYDAQFSEDGKHVFGKLTCGNAEESTLFISYDAPELPAVAPFTYTPAPEASSDALATGIYTTGRLGSYFAQHSRSVFLADQVANSIVHFDFVTDTEINNFKLDAQPKNIMYHEGTNTLYISFETASKIGKINLDNGAISYVAIAGEPLYLDFYNDRLYYTTAIVANQSNSLYFKVNSLGLDDKIFYHGDSLGEIFRINPVNGELVIMKTELAQAFARRHNILATTPNPELSDPVKAADPLTPVEVGTLEEIQFRGDLGLNVVDMEFSPDGQQLTIISNSGNSNTIDIYDLKPSNLDVANGEYVTGARPLSGDFSNSGTMFAATNAQHLHVYDATSHVKLQEHNVDEDLCGLGNYKPLDAQFSADSQHVMLKLVCGNDIEKSLFFLFPVP